MQRFFAALVIVLAGTATVLSAHAQSVGGACTTGQVASPDVNGNTLQCLGSVWTVITPAVPSGAIVAFAASTCPTGWSEYTAARGRFLRGLDNGVGLDPSGTRVAGGQQGDALQNVSGTFLAFTYGSGNVTGAVTSAVNNASILGGSGTYNLDNFTFNAAGVARTSTETRPANVAVLFCSKN